MKETKFSSASGCQLELASRLAMEPCPLLIHLWDPVQAHAGPTHTVSVLIKVIRVDKSGDLVDLGGLVFLVSSIPSDFYTFYASCLGIP